LEDPRAHINVARMHKISSVFLTAAFAAASLFVSTAHAGDQTQIGAGNQDAAALAKASPLVTSGREVLRIAASRIRSAPLRRATVDAITDPNACIAHRAQLQPADKSAIVAQLLAAGYLNPNDETSFPGGLVAGVFPPVEADGTACPHLPQPFYAAPGSSSGGHHTYPGGLIVHEAFNLASMKSFAENYERVFGRSDFEGFAVVDGWRSHRDVEIADDIVIGAPLWHDWAKAIVLQWNADGSEFAELRIASSGGHHIIGLAETIKRGFAPDFVVTHASAHTSPTDDEGLVVKWIRAASIIARVDPVAQGYLRLDATGKLRLPAVRGLGSVDLNAAGQTNLLVEYVHHHLSDADWILAEPAVATAELLLKKLAPELGYDTATASDYTTKYRNPALSYLSAERILMIYGHGGLPAVRAELKRLKSHGVI
jgi:hypothetical protein